MAHLSYHELALTQYIMEHHPEMITNIEFIKERASLADLTFEQMSKEGMNVEDAKAEAIRVLFSGLIFSLRDEIEDIVDNYFPEINDKEKDLFIMQMTDMTKKIMSKYDINDDFNGDRQYQAFRDEITGLIQLYLEKNGLQ